MVILNILASKLSFDHDMIGSTINAFGKPSEMIHAPFEKFCFKMSKCIERLVVDV